MYTSQKHELMVLHFFSIIEICCLYFCLIIAESSAKYIENKQSQTTLPFGWDDASCMKTLKALVVNSYNAVSVSNIFFLNVFTTIISDCGNMNAIVFMLSRQDKLWNWLV